MPTNPTSPYSRLLVEVCQDTGYKAQKWDSLRENAYMVPLSPPLTIYHLPPTHSDVLLPYTADNFDLSIGAAQHSSQYNSGSESLFAFFVQA